MCTNFDFPLPVLTEFTAFTRKRKTNRENSAGWRLIPNPAGGHCIWLEKRTRRTRRARRTRRTRSTCLWDIMRTWMRNTSCAKLDVDPSASFGTIRQLVAAYLVHGGGISGLSGSGHISGLSQMLRKQQLCGRAPSAFMHESLCEARLSGRPISYFKCHRMTTYFDDPSAGSTIQTRLPEKKIPVCDLLDLIR